MLLFCRHLSSMEKIGDGLNLTRFWVNWSGSCCSFYLRFLVLLYWNQILFGQIWYDLRFVPVSGSFLFWIWNEKSIKPIFIATTKTLFGLMTHFHFRLSKPSKFWIELHQMLDSVLNRSIVIWFSISFLQILWFKPNWKLIKLITTSVWVD